MTLDCRLLPRDISADSRLPHDTASSVSLPESRDWRRDDCVAVKDQGSISDDSTSCEIAAGIIASIRGHNNEKEARAELGCSLKNHCRVKNTLIFRKWMIESGPHLPLEQGVREVGKL